MAADGLQNKKIAENLHVRPKVVTLWRNRFVAHRLNGIRADAPRPGRKPKISQEKIDAIVTAPSTRSLRARRTGALAPSPERWA